MKVNRTGRSSIINFMLDVWYGLSWIHGFRKDVYMEADKSTSTLEDHERAGKPEEEPSQSGS